MKHTRPALEVLEDRTVPSTLTNQAFVASVYQGFLGHAPSSGDLNSSSNLLNGGVPAAQVASGLLAGAAYQAREVESLYQSLLGHGGDSSSLKLWTQALHGGASLDQVKAALLSSDEFFSKSGGTPQGFLTALYQDVLGRPPEQAALTLFGPGAAGGQAGRFQTAAAVLTSGESENAKLGNFYQEVLGRAVDSSSLLFWGGFLASGGTDEAVLADLLGSAEFLSSLQSGTAGAGDPVQAASGFIASGKLFQLAAGNGSLDAQAVFHAVQSPPFGSLTFPAGFDPTQVVSSAAVSGPGGFLPGLPGAAGGGTNPFDASTFNTALGGVANVLRGETPGAGPFAVGLGIIPAGIPGVPSTGSVGTAGTGVSPFAGTSTGGVSAGYNASQFTGFGQTEFGWSSNLGGSGYLVTPIGGGVGG